MTVVALVPARGGSKGVPGKNVIDLGGSPLLAWSVRAGLAASSVDRVIVTTDSEEIAQLGRNYGGEAPFLRPPELSKDDSLDIDYVVHALDWLQEHGDDEPELILQLRPTTPLRDPQLIDDAVQAIRERDDATGLRAVHNLPEPPQKMLGIEAGLLGGLFPHDTRPEYYNLPRQSFPPAYWPNGYVDAIRPRTVRGGGGLYGSAVLAFVTPTTVEVDTPDDLNYLRYTVEHNGHPLLEELEQTS